MNVLLLLILLIIKWVVLKWIFCLAIQLMCSAWVNYIYFMLRPGHRPVLVSDAGRLGSSVPRYSTSYCCEIESSFILAQAQRTEPALFVSCLLFLVRDFTIVARHSLAPDTSWMQWEKRDMTSPPCSCVEASVRTLCSCRYTPTSRVSASSGQVGKYTDLRFARYGRILVFWLVWNSEKVCNVQVCPSSCLQRERPCWSVLLSLGPVPRGTTPPFRYS